MYISGNYYLSLFNFCDLKEIKPVKKKIVGYITKKE